uniref:BTB domain-containing protein n=1 Tax=Steinernema glaseri TaxID=37863 RepID=A0A1I8AQV3_9BILA
MSHATITGTLTEPPPPDSDIDISVHDVEVEIGKTKWSLLYCQFPTKNNKTFTFRCSVAGGDSLLWNCVARGRLTIGKNSVMWSGSFNHSTTPACSSIFELPCTEKSNFEAEIEVISKRIIDLSSPTNEAIKSPEDAACLDVDNHKVWVSKKLLSCQSPFFKTLFFGDFKEKATESYSLKAVKFAAFKLFLAVILDVDVVIRTEAHFEDLLRLGDMYQCDTVISFCRDLMRNSKTEYVSLKTKILFCDRQGFSPLLADIIRNAPLDDLKEFISGGYREHLRGYAVHHQRAILHVQKQRRTISALQSQRSKLRARGSSSFEKRPAARRKACHLL